MADEAKYHHLVPRTYLSAWANKSGTLLVKNIETGINEPKNMKNMFGVNHYHSVIAGMPLCTEEDAKTIFASLKDFDVLYEGAVVAEPLKLNDIYYDFDNWQIIRRGDGTAVSKKKIKDAIDQVKIRDIESAWSAQYENKWPEVRKEIEGNVLKAKGGDIPEFQKNFLMRFYTSMDWRGFAGNQQFEKVFDQICKDAIQLDEIEIPEDERGLPIFKTAYDYMKHCLLLKFFRRFLTNDGPMYVHATQNELHTNFHFLVADGTEKFATSDNPSFEFVRDDGKKQGLMPITPSILLAQGRASDETHSYCVTHITEEAVRKYNRIITENAEQYIILDNSKS